jgi:hypothetical protein
MVRVRWLFAFGLITGTGLACSAITSFDGFAGTPNDAAPSGDGTVRSDGSSSAGDSSADAAACADGGCGAADAAATCDDADLTTSANCGACGHDCFGGPCTNGTCGAVPIVGGFPGMFFIEVGEGVVAASYDGDSGDTGYIVGAQVDGSALHYVATDENTPSYLTLDRGRLYYASFRGDAIRSALWDGGDNRLLAPATLPNQTVMTSQGLAWAEQGDGSTNGGVYVLDLTSGTVTPIVTDQIGPEGLVLTDAGFVFSDFDYSGVSIIRVDAPDAATTLATGKRPFGVATDGPYVYWSDTNANLIKRTDVVTGTTVQLAIAGKSPVFVRVDETYVYWVENALGNVRRIRKDGSGMPELLFSGNGQVSGLALDAKAIYFGLSDVGNVMKLAK